MFRFLFLHSLFFILHSAYSQPPVIQWQKSYGGTGTDIPWSVQQTREGGFIVVGETTSNNGNVSGQHGGAADIWLLKIDSLGNIQWRKCLGGTSHESGHNVKQTTDGGYIVAGITNSDDGDVNGLHIDFFSNDDYWVVKTDSVGNIVWQKCLGGTENDWAYAVQQTRDGGYIVSGLAQSLDGDVTNSHGDDYWVVKLNSSGQIQWQKCYGGSHYEKSSSIAQTNDGGYIIGGYTDSGDGDVTGYHGNFSTDSWIIKLDSIGNLQWEHCFGGSQTEDCQYVLQTFDGGYIFTGTTLSDDGDVSGYHGNGDVWVVKLDSSGLLEWQKCLGGAYGDLGYSIWQTTDSGFVVAGSTSSNDGDVSGHKDLLDFWIVKIDQSGIIQWQQCLGGSDIEEAYSIQQTSDGGFIVAGYSYSSDGDVTYNHGGYCSSFSHRCEDFWLVKLSPEIVGISEPRPIIEDLTVFITSSKNLLLRFFSRSSEKMNMNLMDITGRVLLQKEFNVREGLNRHEEPVRFLGRGVYFVRLEGKEGAEVKKVVVQ